MRTVLVWVGLAVAGLVVAAVWYLARTLERDVFRVRERNDQLDLEVVGLTDGAIRLKPVSADAAKEVRRPGSYGFEFEEGYGRAGRILELPEDPWAAVTREFTADRGTVNPGTRGRMDSFTFAPDPSAVGLEWEPVEVPSAASARPAWLIRRDPSRWVVLVHGKGARREEALRVLAAVSGAGWSSLTITYRNDLEHAGGGYYRYGIDEWEDLEAAVRFATESGATEVVIAGYSMGGAIALSFMGRSSLAHMVRGLILDSPMSDLGTLLTMRLKERGVPARLTRMATAVAGRRAGVRASEADYGRWEIDVPVLLMHGEEDDVIPIALSERFAAGRENVTFLRIPGAGHVRGWNVDPDGYEAAVRTFLRGI